MTLDQLWDRLRLVRRLSFVARSEGTTGWNGKGAGTVVVGVASDGTLTFTESGTWHSETAGRDIRFSNIYRWTLVGEVVRLEHLRQGVDNPVYLFDLSQTGEQEWCAASPHLCRDDCYSATMVVHDDRIELRWTISGPRKRETIAYVYMGQVE
jgi:hypothetical protein